jgi:flagellin-like hook-associated protein FlgL
MFQFSSDGGLTWSESQYFTNMTIPVTYSDGKETGLFMLFTPGFIAEGDEFRLNVVPGRFSGNEHHKDVNNNMFSRITSNVTGFDVFEDSGLMDTLYRIKFALQGGNNLEVSQALADLEVKQSDMQQLIVTTGITMNRLEVTKSNLMLQTENVLDNIQNLEQLDVVDLLTRYAMAENALNASIAALSQVFPMSLMNYIR